MMDNCFATTKKLLKILKVPFSNGFLKEKILTHPQYPSLLSVSDTLQEYGIESLAIKHPKKELDDLPLPGIVQVFKGKEMFFNIITSVSNQAVSLIDEEGIAKKMSTSDFFEIWTGVILLLEKGENATEHGIRKKSNELLFLKTIGTICCLSLISWFLLISFESAFSLVILSYFLLKALGLFISILLLWYQQNKDNPTLNQFCTNGGKSDCNSVLDSKDFQWLDGKLNPSMLAFAYFTSSIGVLTISGSLSLALLGWLSVITLPIIAYSFFYQASVIKNWCRFCLLIQGILFLEAVTMFGGKFWLSEFQLSPFLLFCALFCGTILGGVFLISLLGLIEKVYKTQRELNKFKSNKELFELSLTRSKKIVNDPQGLGIFIKGENSKFQVTKVCNPYCGPCSRVHPVLENLFEKGNIDLQIIFASRSGDEKNELAIQHFLAIAEKDDLTLTRNALDDWYLADEKDYIDFAKKYPLNEELFLQKEKLKLMEDWCEKESISYTPTLFINGYELPKEYKVEDLHFVLS
ncbi:VKOR family protein [Algoriphagus aestuarii]|nr:VKOR family protein [Algoriphagus aestuarii]